MGAMKRPSDAPVGVAAKRPTLGAALVVRTKPGLVDDGLGIQALVGELKAVGENHGRKTYQKIGAEVFLYYWDKRDGEDFAGWWFGDSVGGSQVWSRNSSEALAPPRVGWRVPWDGQPSNDMLFVEPAKAGVGAPAASAGAVEGAPNELVRLANENVTAIEGEAAQALEAGQQTMASPEITEDTLRELEANLRQRQASVTETLKSLASDMNDARTSSANPTVLAAINKLMQRLRPLQARFTAELAKVRGAMGKASEIAAANAQKAPSGVVAPRLGAAAGLAAAGGNSGVDSNEVLKVAEQTVCTLEAEATEAIKVSKAKITLGCALEDAVKEVESALKVQQAGVLDTMKSLAADIRDARASGAAPGVLTAINKLSIRLRPLQANLVAEITRVDGQLGKAKLLAAQQKQMEEQQAKIAEAEKRDAEAWQGELPEVTDVVGQAEDAVENCTQMASPLLDTAAEDMEDKSAAMEEVEKMAANAQEVIIEARTMLTKKVQAVKQYAPEVKKASSGDISSLQTKLMDAQKKLNPLKKFRQEFEQRLAAKKVLAEILVKVEEAELEVEKAIVQGDSATAGQMSEEELKAADETTVAAHAAILETVKMVEPKIRTAQGILRDELVQVQDRIKKCREKLLEVQQLLKGQREAFTSQAGLEAAREKVEAAEATLDKMSESEMPFLKGIEVLPKEEALTAINDSEAASKTSETAVLSARAFLNQKKIEAIKYANKEMAKTVTAELEELQQKIEEVAKKLDSFKKETSARKVAAISAEINEQAGEAEQQTQTMLEMTKVLSSDGLSDISIDDLKSTCEKAAVSEKAASSALLEARKLLSEKQREAKTGGKADMSLANELTKIQARLNAVQQELTKQRKAAAVGEHLIKSKTILVEEEEKMKTLDADVEKVDSLATPVDEKLTDKAIQELALALEAASSSVVAILKTLQANLAGAPAQTKELFTNLVTRGKAAQETLEKVATSTKGEREVFLAGTYSTEAKAKLAAVEAAMQKVDDAELPYLKGIEILPLQEATETIAKSEEAAEAMHKSIGEGKTYIASKMVEVKKFGEEAGKPVLEGFAKVNEEISAFAKKLVAFKSDTASRKRTAAVHQATEKLNDAEADITKASEAVAPLIVEDDDITNEAAADVIKKLKEIMDPLQVVMTEAKGVYDQTLRTTTGFATHAEAQKQLRELSAKVQGAFDKTKKSADEYEQKLMSKTMVVEAEAVTKKAEEAIATIEKAASPLLGEKGDCFLVASKLVVVVGALRDLMKEKSLSRDALFKAICRDGGVCLQADFVAYVAKLPEILSREELEYKAEEVAAMFQCAEKNKDGELSRKEFEALFCEKYCCVHAISVTDIFDISESKAVFKLELNEIVEAVEAPVQNEAGVTRLECHVLGSAEKKGWVTMQGNKGKAYMTQISAFTTFEKVLEAQFAESTNVVNEGMKFLKEKSALIATTKSGPLLATKEQITKLRMQVSTNLTSLTGLKSKVVSAKKEYAAREQKEMMAQAEILQRRVADAILKEMTQKSEAQETKAKTVEETAAPLLKADTETVEAFQTPSTLLEEVEKLCADATADVTAMKASIDAEQTSIATRLASAVKGSGAPLNEAKRELVKLQGKADAVQKRVIAALDEVKAACENIATSRSAQIAAATREDLQKRSSTVEELFVYVSGGQERISEAAFCKYVDALCPALPQEHKKLLFRHVEAEGISLPSFVNLVLKYFKCVKDIAITTEFDIGESKILRKVEKDEVIEVLEGPKTDIKLGMSRVKGKALKDGKIGWISVKGNKSTPYLDSCPKPFYKCLAEVVLEKEAKGEDPTEVRQLKVDEVIEVLEGPRLEKMLDIQRAKCKACKDGKEGWFTVMDKQGNAFAKVGSIYKVTVVVALTDDLDIKACKVLRKLEAGELLSLVEGPSKDGEIFRVLVTAMKDGKEGWVTLKGNAGTQYVTESPKHYVMLDETALQKQFKSEGAEEVRMLEKQEAVEVTEGPKDEKAVAVLRMRCKAASDGAVGWVTLSKAQFAPHTQ